MRRVRVEVPDSALDEAAQTAIRALKAENAKLSRRITKLEREQRETVRLREAVRLIETCASELQGLGFSEADWL